MQQNNIVKNTVRMLLLLLMPLSVFAFDPETIKVIELDEDGGVQYYRIYCREDLKPITVSDHFLEGQICSKDSNGKAIRCQSNESFTPEQIACD